MKIKVRKIVNIVVAAASLGLAACIAGAAPIYTVTLPNGATNTLSEAFLLGLVSSSEGTATRESLIAAEDLRIAGGGRLEINENLKGEGFAGEIHVLPGATLRLTANGALGDTAHGTFVEDGATLETECLDTSANNKLDFAKEHLTFAGTGVCGVGALVARTPEKQERNGVWGGTYLTMTGNAMISTVAGYQDFPNNSTDNSLDMNGHTLTVRGFNTATGARPSGVCLRPVVTNPGHIVITNCGASINDCALLPGGAEHTLTVMNRAALELYGNTDFGRKSWTLHDINSSASLTTSGAGGIWDGPIVADHDLAVPLGSQKNNDGSVVTNQTYFGGKMTIKGKFSVSNSSSAFATPSLTLSSPENDIQGRSAEIGAMIVLNLPVDGALSCATTVVKKASSVVLDSAVAYERLPVVKFTDDAEVSGGITGRWAGVVKEGVGELNWCSDVGFRTLDLNAGRLSLSQALPDVAFYAGLSYSFSSNFTGWSSGAKPASGGYYSNLAMPTNKVVLDFSDVRTWETRRSCPGGSASYWEGYIMNPEPTNVTWRFATCIRYLALLQINGVAIISKQGAKEVAFGNATLKPGANSFVIHSGSDYDCFTYAPDNCATWTNGYAVAVCKTSSTSQDSANFEPLADPGDGSVLRCALEGTPLWAQLGEAWSNEFSAVERLTGTAEATLDMGNRWLHVERLEGVPTIVGRTDCVGRLPDLTVTDVWSVSGVDLAAGRGLVCGPQLVFVDGVKLEIVGGKALRKSGKVTVAESDNPIIGLPEVVSTDGSEFKISKSADGLKIFLEYVPKGLMIIVQ